MLSFWFLLCLPLSFLLPKESGASPETPPKSESSVWGYAGLVVLDLGINWFRSREHFSTGVLIFHLLETALKGGVMLGVLRGKRWAFYVQLLLSLLALVSSVGVLGQANRRAANDPLLWISLGAQILAGIYCAYRLTRRA
jgi:hypothetical protein